MAVGGALFGGGRQAASAKSSLVEFRAGKMNMDEKNLVTADKRKGMIMVDQSDDQLMHFKWKDRTSGNVEDDLIIFPDDIEFKKVNQCTTGRVFLLKFKSSNRKMFFWMQEAKTDKDEEYCKKVNDFLNNPPAPGSNRSGNSGGSGSLGGIDLSNVGDSELQSLLSNMSQQQLMQLFGSSIGGAGGGSGGGLGSLASLLGAAQSPSSGRQRSSGRSRETPSTPSTTSSSRTTTTASSTPATASSTKTTTSSSTSAATTASAGGGANPAIQLSDLQSILSGIKMPEQAEGEGQIPVDLSSGITSEVVGNLLKKPDFVSQMKELLPTEHQSGGDGAAAEEIRSTAQSPPFQQSLQMFSSAFQSCQLAPLIREFGLCEKAVEASAKGDMEAFVKALEEDAKKKKDEPEDMALD